MFAEKPCHGEIKPDFEKPRMARLGVQDERLDIGAENKLLMKRPVKQEQKLVFGVRGRYALQYFKCKPPDAFQAVVQQQTCVDGYFHWIGGAKIGTGPGSAAALFLVAFYGKRNFPPS